MNAKSKIHQANLTQWAARFKDQADSGLTVKVWCIENGFTIHTYNYWKHLLKEQYVSSVLPDIVPLSEPTKHHSNSLSSTHSCNSCNSHNSRNNDSIRITLGDTYIDIGSSATDEMILRIIRAVRYA